MKSDILNPNTKAWKVMIFLFSGSVLILHGVFHPACVMDTLFKTSKHDHRSKNHFKHSKLIGISAYIGSMYPHPGTVTRILAFLVGHPYKPLFVTVTVLGVDRKHTAILARARFQNDFYNRQVEVFEV